MSALSKAREAGFVVRLVDGDKIGITPIERLTDTQKRWLSANRDDVLAELRGESANEPSNVDINLGRRWEFFVSLAIQHDVTADEVSARFTPDDIADLVAQPDNRLPLHAKTIADAVKRSRTRPEDINYQITHSDTPELIRAIHNRSEPQTCGSCQHFRRDERHASLGNCAMGEPEGTCGLWDDDPRNYCASWEVS